MSSVWGVYIPAGAKEFPGPPTLRGQLRQCRCGQMTFLSLPCRNCGAQSSPPAFRRALRRAWARRAGRWVLAAAYLAAVYLAAALIWLPLAWLAAIVTAAALLADAVRRTAEGDICFWLFHTTARGGKKLPPADAAGIEALTDAYDTDLQRLERLLKSDPSPECAERVFHMTQELAGIFHNRQTSALLAKCLPALPVISEGICVDLDQICAWLEPEDLSPGTLEKLAECARLTCLPAGAPTARFVVRFCALRIQQTLKRSSVPRSYYLPDIFRDLSSGGLSEALNLSKEEHGCLSALWNLAAVFSAPPPSPEAGASKYSKRTLLGSVCEDSRYIADCWFWYVWYHPGRTAFQNLDGLLRDKLGTELEEKWRKG